MSPTEEQKEYYQIDLCYKEFFTPDYIAGKKSEYRMISKIPGSTEFKVFPVKNYIIIIKLECFDGNTQIEFPTYKNFEEFIDGIVNSEI